MGNFYVNYTLRGPSQEAVAAALAGRNALVTPQQNGCVVVFDEKSDEQDTDVMATVASHLSVELQCPVLAVLNHDDDILLFQLYVQGDLADEYNSNPGYFDPSSGSSEPAGGLSQKLCDVFEVEDVLSVERVLRKSTFAGDGYDFEIERHEDLIRALNLSEYAVGTSYTYIQNDELPEGLSREDLMDA
jgi:hypothetical protein